jgi:hypothetical protein
LLACNVLIPSEQQNQQEESPPQPMLVILDPDQATISALAGKATTLTMAITPSNGQVCFLIVWNGWEAQVETFFPHLRVTIPK